MLLNKQHTGGEGSAGGSLGLGGSCRGCSQLALAGFSLPHQNILFWHGSCGCCPVLRLWGLVRYQDAVWDFINASSSCC